MLIAFALFVGTIFGCCFGWFYGFSQGYSGGYEASEFRHFWMGSGLDSDLHGAAQEPREDTRLDWTETWVERMGRG